MGEELEENFAFSSTHARITFLIAVEHCLPSLNVIYGALLDSWRSNILLAGLKKECSLYVHVSLDGKRPPFA